jgi:predicted nucleic acid-binding protein
MSLYLDGSVVAKLLATEPDSGRVAEIIEMETNLVVSALARLEALVVIKSLVAAGEISSRTANRRQKQLQQLLELPTFSFERVGSNVFEVAERQLDFSYCPTLDRLHLAVMQDLGLRRILTNDDQQARAARALGFQVVMPR